MIRLEVEMLRGIRNRKCAPSKQHTQRTPGKLKRQTLVRKRRSIRSAHAHLKVRIFVQVLILIDLIGLAKSFHPHFLNEGAAFEQKTVLLLLLIEAGLLLAVRVARAELLRR